MIKQPNEKTKQDTSNSTAYFCYRAFIYFKSKLDGTKKIFRIPIVFIQLKLSNRHIECK